MHRVTALLAVVMIGGWGTPGWADSASADEEARRHFDLGQRHFNVGEFDRAIDEFKEAYEISPVPGLLFNLAQAYRAKKDNEKALYFYQTYLREDPQASERSFVEQRIEELRLSEDTRKAVEAAAMPDRDRGKGLRVAGIATGATGLALAGASIVFGVRAASGISDVGAELDAHGHWTPDLRNRWNDAHRDQTTAWILGAIGVGAVASGGILYYVGAQKSVSVSASPAPGGAGVAVQSSF